MLRFGETKEAKEKFMVQKKKKTLQIWNVNVDNIVLLRLVETKTNFNCLIEFLEKVIRPLLLILPKISGFAKTFIVKNRDKDKNQRQKSFRIDDEKLLEKYKTV